VLVAALSRELAAVRRHWQPGRSWPEAPCRARWYRQQEMSFLVLEIGVGAPAVDRALSWLLQEPLDQGQPFRPSVVISAGFSGALEPGLQVGDVVLADEVSDEAGQVWPLPIPETMRGRLASFPLHRGRILTTSTLIGDPRRKRSLGREHRACAVDMESVFLASWCRQRDVPQVCLRVISDDVDTALSPELTALLAGGRVSAGGLVRALLRRPMLIGELVRLGRHTAHAARCLAEPLLRLIQALAGIRRPAEPRVGCRRPSDCGRHPWLPGGHGRRP
jgi:adenosylhomocysteine nucleosidase